MFGQGWLEYVPHRWLISGHSVSGRKTHR